MSRVNKDPLDYNIKCLKSLHIANDTRIKLKHTKTIRIISKSFFILLIL